MWLSHKATSHLCTSSISTDPFEHSRQVCTTQSGFRKVMVCFFCGSFVYSLFALSLQCSASLVTGLPELTQVSSTAPPREDGGNVHSGAPSPWLEMTEGNQLSSFVSSSTSQGSLN